MEEAKQKNMEEKKEEEEEKKKRKTLFLFSTNTQSFVLVLLHVSATYFRYHKGTIML
jgi:hypothetical protein